MLFIKEKEVINMAIVEGFVGGKVGGKVMGDETVGGYRQ